MHSHRRRLTVMVLVLSMMSLLVGCLPGTNNGEKERETMQQDEIISQMRGYFSDRYGSVPVTVEGFIPSGWDGEDDRLNLSVRMDGIKESFYILRTVQTDGSVTYSDNYLGLLLRGEFERLVSETLQDCVPTHRAYAFIRQQFSQDIPVNTTVSKLAEDGAFFFVDIMVFVSTADCSEADFTSIAQHAADTWEQQGISSYFRILLVDEAVYDSLGRDDLSGSWENRYVADYNRMIG